MPTGYEIGRGVAGPVPAVGEVCSGLCVKMFGRGQYQRLRHLFRVQREERTVARVKPTQDERAQLSDSEIAMICQNIPSPVSANR